MSLNLVDELKKINHEYMKHIFSIMNYEKEIQILKTKINLVENLCNKKRDELINEYNNRSIVSSEEDKLLYYSLIKYLNKMIIRD
jgi:hypothetical protein